MQVDPIPMEEPIPILELIPIADPKLMSVIPILHRAIAFDAGLYVEAISACCGGS